MMYRVRGKEMGLDDIFEDIFERDDKEEKNRQKGKKYEEGDEDEGKKKGFFDKIADIFD